MYSQKYEIGDILKAKNQDSPFQRMKIQEIYSDDAMPYKTENSTFWTEDYLDENFLLLKTSENLIGKTIEVTNPKDRYFGKKEKIVDICSDYDMPYIVIFQSEIGRYCLARWEFKVINEPADWTKNIFNKVNKQNQLITKQKFMNTPVVLALIKALNSVEAAKITVNFTSEGVKAIEKNEKGESVSALYIKKRPVADKEGIDRYIFTAREN